MHLDPARRAVGFYHPQLARLRVAGREEGFAHEVENILVCRKDRLGDPLVGQLAPWPAEQGGGREVAFLDQPRFADGDIADRGHIEEIEIAGTRGVQRCLRLAQLLVLHFQLDLVDEQLVQHPGIVLRIEPDALLRRPAGICQGEFGDDRLGASPILGGFPGLTDVRRPLPLA